jgi:type IV secretory pathway protease TraF
VGSRRRLSLAVVLAVLAAAGWLAIPKRFAIEGVSMGPALLPGDVVCTGPFPMFDRLRRPRRFERWVLDLADGAGIKRVVGLPGEAVAIVAGDLAVGGRLVVKGPRVLGQVGAVAPDVAADTPPADEPGWAWSRPAGEILDDAAFEAGVTRVLAAVRDAGLAAVVDVQDASAADPATARLRVGDAIVARPLVCPGRHAVVAGRLDGRLVVAAWPVAADASPTGGRSCLPPGPPATWDVADPWRASGDGADAPALAIGGDRLRVARVSRWRDVAWRPGADGRAAWRLGVDEVFVLGDFPAASTDSRHWGPVKAAALRQRVVGD